MKIKYRKKISSNIKLSIVEIDNPIVVNNFNRRFQVLLEIQNRRILPMLKNKFCEFESNNYIYLLKSEKNNNFVELNEILFHEKQLCDKTYEECTNELIRFVTMSKKGKNVKRALKRIYNF